MQLIRNLLLASAFIGLLCLDGFGCGAEDPALGSDAQAFTYSGVDYGVELDSPSGLGVCIRPLQSTCYVAGRKHINVCANVNTMPSHWAQAVLNAVADWNLYSSQTGFFFAQLDPSDPRCVTPLTTRETVQVVLTGDPGCQHLQAIANTSHGSVLNKVPLPTPPGQVIDFAYEMMQPTIAIRDNSPFICDPNNTQETFDQTIMHELGHAVGLHHVHGVDIMTVDLIPPTLVPSALELSDLNGFQP